MTVPVIVGAGPAGCAAAITLSRAGVAPVMLERARETGDALCGGFLSWRGMDQLRALGIDGEAIGGQRVTRVRLFTADGSIDHALPRAGLGISRRALDSAMQRAAVAAGAGLERGVRVRATQTGADAVKFSTGDGADLAARALFVAIGKYAQPAFPRPAPGALSDDPVLGLRIRLPASARLDRLVGDAVELFLFRSGYAGLVRQENGSGNLCFALHQSRLDAAHGNPARAIADVAASIPALAERLDACTGPVDAIAGVPYGWRATRARFAGVWQLGDQAACIPSLAGEGMSIAMASGASAARAWASGVDAARWQQDFARASLRPVTAARLLWRASETPAITRPAMQLLRHAPPLLTLAARLTRISSP